jgi:hypothetical protein
MTGAEGTRLEAMLARAKADAEWPPTPDLRDAVVRRIDVPDAPDLRSAVLARIDRRAGASAAGRQGRERPGRVRLVWAIGLAALLLIALAGVAAGLGFRLPGFELVRVESIPPAGAGLDLGRPITIDEARAVERPRVRLPAALRPPDAAYRLPLADGSIVTLAWRAAPGEPTLAGSDLALTLMAVPGDTDEGLIRKIATGATSVEPVTVGADRGWWIAGAPHEILIRGPGGSVDVLRAAIAGDTLVFARDGTLYRLESSLGRDETVRIAQSLR